eukprot:3147403-Prymnesium_polylepis.1
MATSLVAVAAQLLLRAEGKDGGGGAVALNTSGALRPLVRATVGWGASFAHTPRFLATLVLYHALEAGALPAPGWYAAKLHAFVARNGAFRRLRERLQLERWTSD